MFRWTLHLSGGPPRKEHAGVAVGDKVYYFVECQRDNNDNMEGIDVHVFNTMSLRWRTLPRVTPGRGEHNLEVPSLCCGSSAVLVEDVIYLWGGCQEFSDRNVLHAFDVDTHRLFKPRVSGTIPGQRSNHSACVLGKVMYIHGGSTLTGYTNDIYKLVTTTMVWSLVNTRGTRPPPLQRHSATIIGTKMFVFGGRGNKDHCNNTRVFDTETDCWLNTPSTHPLPEGRSSHSAFTYKGELYICGGHNQDRTLSDLWKLNPETFSWKKVEPKGKGPSEMEGMCCCMGDRIVIFGEQRVVCFGEKRGQNLCILDLSPSLKTLCKLAVIQHGLEQAGLTHDVRWELAATTTNRNRH